MASAVFRLFRLSALKSTGVSTLKTGAKCPAARLMQHRNTVYTASGGIPPHPEKTPFGLFRMTVVTLPFLYVGTLISKNFAAYLEENDIFVPDDDDDDD